MGGGGERRARLALAVLLAGILLPTGAVVAHEIPSDVSIRLFLKPEGERLTVLIRVPLTAMRDMDFPTRGPGYLVLDGIEPQLEDAVRLWLIGDLALFEEDERLAAPLIRAVRVALPSDRSFDDFEQAYQAILQRPLDRTTSLYWEQALLDVMLSYPIRSDRSRFALASGLERLGIRTRTEVRFLPPDRAPRSIGFTGNPGRLNLEPGPLEVFGRFLATGFEHVLDGTDHLLFLFALVIPLHSLRRLVVVVSAFTLAHSLTLAATALQLVPEALWFPPLVELLIAASIVWMVVENLLRRPLAGRWRIAFLFGLVHGFGFSFALTEALQLAGDRVLVSLAGFNLGIELGALLVIGLLVPVLRLAYRWLPETGLALLLSVLVGHSAWHWLLERWELLAVHSLTVPALDAALLLGVMRWTMLGLVAALLIWLLKGPFERWSDG
jgi:hypothetical protein